MRLGKDLMTTYLSTQKNWGAEDWTQPYCSEFCRDLRDGASHAFLSTQFRDDDAYEFDETCATCGKLIPASA